MVAMVTTLSNTGILSLHITYSRYDVARVPLGE
jgi:hypothetical protein